LSFLVENTVRRANIFRAASCFVAPRAFRQPRAVTKSKTIFIFYFFARAPRIFLNWNHENCFGLRPASHFLAGLRKALKPHEFLPLFEIVKAAVALAPTAHARATHKGTPKINVYY